MSFTDMIRANVDNIPVNIPKDTTPEEIVRAVGQDPGNRDVVLCHPDGTVDIVPRRRRLSVKEGQRFETQIPCDGGC